MSENGFHELRVNRHELFTIRILSIRDSHISSKSSGYFVSSNSGRGVHRGYYLNSFEINELQVIVIKPFVTDDLLQESNQLDGVVLVRLR